MKNMLVNLILHLAPHMQTAYNICFDKHYCDCSIFEINWLKQQHKCILMTHSSDCRTQSEANERSTTETTYETCGKLYFHLQSWARCKCVSSLFHHKQPNAVLLSHFEGWSAPRFAQICSAKLHKWFLTRTL